MFHKFYRKICLISCFAFLNMLIPCTPVYADTTTTFVDFSSVSPIQKDVAISSTGEPFAGVNKNNTLTGIAISMLSLYGIYTFENSGSQQLDTPYDVAFIRSIQNSRVLTSVVNGYNVANYDYSKSLDSATLDKLSTLGANYLAGKSININGILTQEELYKISLLTIDYQASGLDPSNITIMTSNNSNTIRDYFCNQDIANSAMIKAFMTNHPNVPLYVVQSGSAFYYYTTLQITTKGAGTDSQGLYNSDYAEPTIFMCPKFVQNSDGNTFYARMVTSTGYLQRLKSYNSNSYITFSSSDSFSGKLNDLKMYIYNPLVSGLQPNVSATYSVSPNITSSVNSTSFSVLNATLSGVGVFSDSVSNPLSSNLIHTSNGLLDSTTLNPSTPPPDTGTNTGTGTGTIDTGTGNNINTSGSDIPYLFDTADADTPTWNPALSFMSNVLRYASWILVPGTGSLSAVMAYAQSTIGSDTFLSQLLIFLDPRPFFGVFHGSDMNIDVSGTNYDNLVFRGDGLPKWTINVPVLNIPITLDFTIPDWIGIVRFMLTSAVVMPIGYMYAKKFIGIFV